MKIVFSTIIALICSLLLFLPQPATAEDPSNLLRIRLSSGKSETSATGQFVIHFAMENISGQTLTILTWNTPLAETIGSPILTVERDGQPVRYIGKLIKRRPPQAEDYLVLAPGETAEGDLDLAGLYDLSMPGTYRVGFRLQLRDIQEAQLPDGLPAAKDTGSAIPSNTLEQELAVPIVPPARQKAPNFSGCSYWEQNQLAVALTAAQGIARTAKEDLENAPVDQRNQAERYLEWFGVYDSSRYATVQSHFNNLDDALSNRQITFVCDCTDDYYAYVYPSIPYEIHPCNSFWNAPLTGTDSQAGTIVHETSHFTVVADTDDHAYGQYLCRQLADSSPWLAIENADSHEYFAENTPALSMPQPTTTPTTPTTPTNTDSLLQVILDFLLLHQ